MSYILIVDEERVAGDVIKRVLESEFDVTVLESGKFVLDKGRKGADFDVVPLNLNMPVMSDTEASGKNKIFRN